MKDGAGWGKITDALICSWKCREGMYTQEEILAWVKHFNDTAKVNIYQTGMEENGFWFYDVESGRIRNRNSSFFSVSGLIVDGLQEGNSKIEQPIIIQPEIGYLGILCKQIHGVLHFLMQAKIEPGNINKIQISPTIQATKSNFTQKHGGNKPAYLEYFVADKEQCRIVDQIQSEQSSRFLGKRNRNTVILLEDECEITVYPNFKWMTLGQIKELMKQDNLVNMDTRTVLSCLPYFNADIENGICTDFQKKLLLKEKKPQYTKLFTQLNNCKMFDAREKRLVPLSELGQWQWEGNEFKCREKADFSVIFCNIAIEGREVVEWTQPLFKASGKAVFGLAYYETDTGVRFLVRVKMETGCFDVAELGPTVQMEPTKAEQKGYIEERFFGLMEKRDVVFDALLSEEGGRFYHEQNRNILLKVEKEDFGELPADCFWVDFITLNALTQVNNVLNIQLRNLLSLIEADPYREEGAGI